MLMRLLELAFAVGTLGLIFTHSDGFIEVITGAGATYAKTVKGLEAF